MARLYSLGQTTRISFNNHLLLVLFLVIPICSTISVHAAEPTAVHRLPEMVVTATHVDTNRQDIAAHIEVLDREELDKLPISNVAEALQYMPGVYIEFNGGLGSFAAGTRIQGSEPRHVAIFQDGVPLNQLDNPLVDLSFLPIDAVERIEVYKGAASSAWGSALGGVINIITKEPDPGTSFSGDVRASYGEFNTVKSRGTFSGAKDRWGYLLSLTHDQTDGYRDYTKYQQDAVYAKIFYDVGDNGLAGFVYSYDQGNSADPILAFPQFWDDTRVNRTYQQLFFETGWGEGWEFHIDARHHYWDVFIEDVYPDRREIFNDYSEESFGGGMRLSYRPGRRHTVNFGFDGNMGDYEGNSYERTYETGNWAVYANDTFRWRNISVNAGLRYDDDRTFGGALSPSAGLVYHLWQDKARIRVQAARGFSAPPASWVYDPNFGNRNLNAETATNWQAGIEIQPTTAIEFEATVFRADVDDLIRFNFDSGHFENIDETVRQGVEGSLYAILPWGFRLSLSASYVDVRNDLTDEVIEDIPRSLHTVRVTHEHKRLSHSLAGTYTDHNSSHPETKDQVFIFNYYFSFKLPWSAPYVEPSIFGSAYNLFATSYIYRDIWPKPPRWIEAGLRFKF